MIWKEKEETPGGNRIRVPETVGGGWEERDKEEEEEEVEEPFCQCWNISLEEKVGK